jgi:hypothetical protein
VVEEEDKVEDDQRDLDWSTVLKRTFESYVRGERCVIHFVRRNADDISGPICTESTYSGKRICRATTRTLDFRCYTYLIECTHTEH